ncbi:MAG: hypothetical protein ACREJU_01835, partial [Nitrospiraceae bacterium]
MTRLSSMGRRIVLGGLVFAMLVVGGLVHFGLAQETKTKATIEKVFPNSSKCKRCHERAFEEWETSPLSRSIHSPAFRASLDEY